MSPRGRFALGILAVWTLTLGWHAKRLYFRPIQELVAEASRTIPPGTAYYRVYQGDLGRVGGRTGSHPRASPFLGDGKRRHRLHHRTRRGTWRF
jgi:hypothetical protein